MQKVIVTVVGKDKVGIIAKVCSFLAEQNINILDISQTIVGGYFNMMMVTDISSSQKSFLEVMDEISALGKEIGVLISMQKEEIFDSMHRI
jgi:ACT domain-containing protein